MGDEMTPLQLSILIHYYGHAEDYRFGDFSAPAVREAIDLFNGDADLLEHDFSGYPKAVYKLTEKGKFFVEHLCSVPLPVPKHSWMIPK